MEPKKPTFSGPVKQRTCTDTCYGLAFLFACIGLGTVALWSYIMGDYRLLLYPRDSNDKICGIDYPDKPLLVFFDNTKCYKFGSVISIYHCPTRQVCVSKCPEYNLEFKKTGENVTRSLMICREGASGDISAYDKISIENLIKLEMCAPRVQTSVAVFGRCIPRIKQVRNATIKEKEPNRSNTSLHEKIAFQMKSLFTNGLKDMSRQKESIIFFLICAVIGSLTWIYLIRVSASIIVCLSLLSLDIFFMTASIDCFWRYFHMSNVAESPDFSMDFSWLFEYAVTWLILAIICLLIFLAITFLMVFLKERIRLTVAILIEASKAIEAIPTAIFWPIVPVFLISGLAVFGIIVDIHLRSLDHEMGVGGKNVSDLPEEMSTQEWLQWVIENAVTCKREFQKNTTLQTYCRLIRHRGKRYIALLQVYNFLICIWIWNFIMALKDLTLAGAFVTYYFSRSNPQKSMPKYPVLRSFNTAFYFHFGSLAMGSMLLAGIGFIQSALLILQRRLKYSTNPVSKFINQFCCLCCGIIDFFFRFLNEDAYVMMAIYGHKFSEASKTAFDIIFRNIVRMLVIDRVTNFVLKVGKYVICGVIALIAECYYDGTLSKLSGGLIAEIEPQMYSTPFIVTIIVIASFIISSIFFSVFEIGVDSIFLCFCVDLEENDGSKERPYFMNGNLMKLYGNLIGKSR